jgi:N-acetylneuraminic acid mutarotase
MKKLRLPGVNGKQIFIIGGVDDSKSIEVFDWSTKTWTLMENVLFFSSVRSSSFLYGKRIMVCGGDSSKRIEFLDPSENGFTSTALPGSLPSTDLNGVLVENRIITFGCDVHETSLQRPWTSTVLIYGDWRYSRSSCALERIGSDIFVIGYCGVERYDTANKQLRTLTSLPYSVFNMASVTYKDNIIILGGKSDTSDFQPLDDVVMFNICNLECKRLPSMLQKRSGCAAAIMGDVVVVMGGESKDAEGQTISLKTAEYFVIGESKWQELPAMNQARVYPTACVYP